MKEQETRITFRIVQIVLLCIAIPGLILFFYSSSYYSADTAVKEALVPDDAVHIVEVGNEYTVFSPDNPMAELIFYPGAKIEYKAYAPLMRSLAKNGILCIMMNMPYNLAILDTEAADRVIDLFPQITHRYICGHSLGATAAAEYAAKHADKLDGLIMLAGYSAKNLRESGLSVLSVYGSCDSVLDLGEYKRCLELLPENKREYVIEGGCHSYFGSYGLQSGDGKPSIEPAQQTAETTEVIIMHINSDIALREKNE